MTTIPHLRGTNPKHRAMAAARAILATSPAGTELVLDERPVDKASQSTIHAKASRINARDEFRARVTRENGVLRVYLRLNEAPTTEQNFVPTVIQTSTETLESVVLEQPRARRVGERGPDKRKRTRSGPTDRTATFLNRVLDRKGGWVTVTTFPTTPTRDLSETTKVVESRRTALLAMARKAGVSVETKVRATSSGVRLDGRLRADKS